MRKFFKITAISLFILILLAFLLPYLFKDKLLVLAKSEINKNIEAKIEFKDLDLSLFRHFPKLSIALKDISVTGLNEFAGDTLLSAPMFDASVNLMSVIGGKNIKLHGIYLESPRIHALVNKEGKANWEITKPDTAVSVPDSSAPIEMELEKIFYQRWICVLQ